MAPAKRFANTKDTLIQAVLGGHYVFATLPQAQTQLGILKTHYFISRLPDHADTPDYCTLWVRGHDVTDAQKARGAQGNFVNIQCVKTAPERYGFAARTLETDISTHPQRSRTPSRHPNWGHPVLRAVEKKRLYPTVEQAQAELTLLQQEYPHAAIPGPNKLFVMIYGRSDDKKRQVKKYVLEIVLADEGGYRITSTLNTPKPRSPKPAAPETPDTPVGSFTAALALKRNRKKPK